MFCHSPPSLSSRLNDFQGQFSPEHLGKAWAWGNVPGQSAVLYSTCLKGFKQIVRVPIQRTVPPRPFHGGGIQPVLSWLKPKSEASVIDFTIWLKRLVRWGKRDISQERDNPHFLIRFPNTTLFLMFFHLVADLSLESDNTPQCYEVHLCVFVPSMWRVQNPCARSTSCILLCCHKSWGTVITWVLLHLTMIFLRVRVVLYLFL